MDKLLIVAIIVFFLLGVGVGIGIGMKIVEEKVIDIAQRFINIDEEAIRDALYRYENNIKACYPTE